MTDASSRNSDPEPLTVAAICVATLAMAGTVANAYVNYRKLVRDDEIREGVAVADFLSHCDALRAAGDRLHSVVQQVGDYGQAAFRMTHRLPRSTTSTQGPALTLRAGESSLDLTPDERQRWDVLVQGASRAVVAMNEAVSAYEEVLAALLASGRKLEQALGVSLESVIGNVVDHSITFRKAVDSYQNLRAGSRLEDAEVRFNRLRIATAGMVEAANGFAGISTMFIQHRRDKSR
jgi:hypothetical protein